MLGKLLKYDLKYMMGNILVFYILTLFFAISTRIFSIFDGPAILVIISKISIGCLISFTINILINTLMRSWVRFKDSIFKDEAYLTHTLPVTKNEIYDSKFFQTLIFLLIDFVVILISLIIAFYTKERWQSLKNMLGEISSSLDFSTTVFVIGAIAIVFLELFNGLQCGYFGTLIGFRRNSGKIGFSVLFGFTAYVLSQSVVVLMIFGAGLFSSNIMELFKNNTQLSLESIRVLILICILFYSIVIGAMNILCKRIFNKGVNLE